MTQPDNRDRPPPSRSGAGGAVASASAKAADDPGAAVDGAPTSGPAPSAGSPVAADLAETAPGTSTHEPPVAPSTEVKIRLFARTDVGQVREHNEDNFLVADLTKRERGLSEGNRATTLGPHGAVFAVCDGMGGAAAGEVASQLAVDILLERMTDGLDDRATARDEIARRLVRAVESAGLRIFQEAKVDRSRRGMGTTVTAAALVDNHLFLAQVGDSRGYILRGDQLVQVTRDQSLVNQLIEAGQLTEEEAETFEHNNIILQALGTSDTVAVDLTFVELRLGDILLLCSDGLSGMVRFDDIREILKSSSEPLEICKAMTERANQAGGHDNITVIVAQFEGDGLLPATAVPDAEPLRYRKYNLPEEASELTEPGRRSHRDIIAAARAARSSGDPDHDLDGDPDDDDDHQSGPIRVAMVGSTPVIGASPSDAWHERGPHPDFDERIDIPGTHVPGWVVIALVVGVILLLGGAAFLLLR
jgi:serine/threonine protein phosphatase PrpC